MDRAADFGSAGSGFESLPARQFSTPVQVVTVASSQTGFGSPGQGLLCCDTVMAELVPYPFPALARRMFRELERNEAIFDLPASRFVSDPGRDLAVRSTGTVRVVRSGRRPVHRPRWRRTSCSPGSAAAAIMELKTVQIDDELRSRGPASTCRRSDSTSSGRRSSSSSSRSRSTSRERCSSRCCERGPLPSARGFERVVYDLSVGYDLAGIQTSGCSAFIRGMQDASRVVERLRAEIPASSTSARPRLPHPAVRHGDAEHVSRLPARRDRADHRVPAARDRAAQHHQVQPDAARAGRARELLHDTLGYEDFRSRQRLRARHPLGAGGGDARALSETAAAVGLGLGAKFSNTLIVENDRGFLSDDVEEAYLSGRRCTCWR